MKGFVTIGSPLANGQFNVDDLFKLLRTPLSNVSWWVNFGVDLILLQQNAECRWLFRGYWIFV